MVLCEHATAVVVDPVAQQQECIEHSQPAVTELSGDQLEESVDRSVAVVVQHLVVVVGIPLMLEEAPLSVVAGTQHWVAPALVVVDTQC